MEELDDDGVRTMMEPDTDPTTLPRFEPLMRFRAIVSDELVIPRPHAGAKLSVCYFTGGDFVGSRLRGRLLPGGGDWAEYDSDRLFRIDVRSVLETDDGALIYLRYWGLWSTRPGMLDKIFAPGGFAQYKPEDHYLRVSARFETHVERYAWLNELLAIGIGSLAADGVIYDFYTVL